VHDEEVQGEVEEGAEMAPDAVSSPLHFSINSYDFTVSYKCSRCSLKEVSYSPHVQGNDDKVSGFGHCHLEYVYPALAKGQVS
jgi:hypothetical protein